MPAKQMVLHFEGIKVYSKPSMPDLRNAWFQLEFLKTSGIKDPTPIPAQTKQHRMATIWIKGKNKLQK